MTTPQTSSPNPIKAILWILNLLTFSLVLLGGTVHNTGSSLACPDWPLCFGQVFPKMEGAVAIEHSHRLLAAFVGLLTLTWLFFAHRKNSPKQKFLSKAATFFVIFQGLLGGLTVILKISPLMSTAHLVTSQIFLSIIWVALLTEIYSKELLGHQAILPPSTQFKWAPTLLVLILTQMGLGAFIRHSGASVSCGLGPDSLWLCVDANDQLLKLWPTNWPGQFNMLHRFFGIALFVATIAATIPTLKWAKANKFKNIRLTNIFIHAVLLIQVLLGFATLYTGIDIAIVTAHLLFAMLLWLAVWKLWISCIAAQPHTTGSPTNPLSESAIRQ